MSRQKGITMQKTILWVLALVFTTNILTINAVTLGDVGLDNVPMVKLVGDTELYIKQILFSTTKKYGIESQNKLLLEVIRCESQFNRYAIGDNGHSRGLVQIYDTYHPDITHEQAFDPVFAIDFLVKNVAEGRGDWWTCYRNLQ